MSELPKHNAKKLNITTIYTVLDTIFQSTWLCATCPSSWLTTPMISFWLLYSIKVSKITTFLHFQNPVTNALEWLDLFEPSITFISLTLTFVLRASSKIADFRLPCSSSEKVKKQGITRIGTIMLMSTMNPIDSDARLKTNLSPPMSTTYRMQGTTTAIKTKLRIKALILSVTKVYGVVLLNPYFCSILKVLYTLKGKLMNWLISTTIVHSNTA